MGRYGRVLYSFSPRYPDEIQVSFNNVVTIISDYENEITDWIEIDFNGKTGKIPKLYVEPYDLCGAEARVLHDFTPDDESGQFLRLEKGETIVILNYDSTGWDVGYSSKNNRVGAVPHNFVKILNPSSINDIKDVFFADNMALIPVLCIAIDTSTCEAFSKDLTLLYEHHGQTFDYLQRIIRQEVENTVNEGTLFRKNNLTSYSMTAYARYIGNKYLKHTLSPLISGIATCAQSCEIDPHRVEKDELEENIRTLQKTSQMFLHKIMESVNNVPIALRNVCNLLRDIVAEKFPSSKRKVIGGFYFLRFICPAVVSPEGFGVIDKIDAKTRRGLILISKIIQTLSNGVVFGKKEEYMIPMNNFINENLENVHYVLDKIATIIPDIHNNIERLPPLGAEEYEKIIKRLHGQILLSMPKILTMMKTLNIPARFQENFTSVMLRFGPPLIVKPPEPKPASNLVTRDDSSVNNNNNNNNNNVNSLMHSADDVYRNDKKLADKKQKEEKRIQEKKMRDEKKLKEKEKIKKKNEFPMPEGNVLIENYILRKTKGNFNTIQWVKKYYAIFSISSRIYVANSPEDLRENRFLGFIELFPAFTTTLIGKSKNPIGWEIRLVTAQEHFLIFQNEGEMRSWVGVLDRRLSEILLPEQSLKKKEELLRSMETKLEKYNSDLELIKAKLSSKVEGEDRSMDEKHFEETLVTFNELQRSIERVKRERDHLALTAANVAVNANNNNKV